jgi:hypothetical protein
MYSVAFGIQCRVEGFFQVYLCRSGSGSDSSGLRGDQEFPWGGTMDVGHGQLFVKVGGLEGGSAALAS